MITMPITQPQTTLASRRLVVAANSSHRIIDLQPSWWRGGEAVRSSCWNGAGLAQLLDATMASGTNNVIVDLTRKRGDHWTHLYLPTLRELGGFDELLEILEGRVGKMRIHYGYDARTETTKSFDFKCGGDDNSVVNMISGGVWHGMTQIYHSWPNGTISASWVTVLKAIGGLDEPAYVKFRTGELVGTRFDPYDQVVEVLEPWDRNQPPLFKYRSED